MVEHPLDMRWIVRSIPAGEPTELFIICSKLCSTTGVTKVVVCTTLSEATAGFLFHYSCGP